MDAISEFLGLPDRYWSKMLSPHTSSGRQANWSTLQLVVDGLYPDGFDLKITPRRGPRLDVLRMKFAIMFDRKLANPLSRRELLAEWGRRGGTARWKNSTAEERKKFARKGGRSRARALAPELRTKLALHAAAVRHRRAKNRP
jgi:hypothetical protein